MRHHRGNFELFEATMSEHPVLLSRSSRHGYVPEQGDPSDSSLLSFGNSPETAGLVTGPWPEPPRHLEVTWSTDEQGHLDAAIVGHT
ncbi:hypothetical protein ABZV93_24060 [Actinopolymorpha sp. NPDC004070]|uniref:hypothetical protein n=1 Tax=Actinopolymorpha sp. NPDC004070 TaxID=3154548 RepID=UPI0033A64270